MGRKYSITVPDLIGRVIDNMSKDEGSKPTSAAAFILETAVKNGLRDGLFPPAWADTECDEQPSDDVSDLALRLLSAIITGEELDPSIVASVAKYLDVSPHDLLAKLKKKEGNGSESRITR